MIKKVQARLRLDRHTLRELTVNGLRRAAGGVTKQSRGCVTDTCSTQPLCDSDHSMCKQRESTVSVCP